MNHDLGCNDFYWQALLKTPKFHVPKIMPPDPEKSCALNLRRVRIPSPSSALCERAFCLIVAHISCCQTARARFNGENALHMGMLNIIIIASFYSVLAMCQASHKTLIPLKSLSSIISFSPWNHTEVNVTIPVS